MKQTKKLLKGLEGDGINVRALANFSSENGIYVNLRCYRIRGRISLPSELIGVQKMSDQAKEAYASYVSLGQLSFIPAEDDAKLAKIEAAIRYKLLKATISNGFMPLKKYTSFKVEFENAKGCYFVERDRLLANWDDLMRNFTKAVDTILEESTHLMDKDRVRIRSEILDRIPGKKEYANSFRMSLDVQTFPAKPDITKLPEELSDDVLNSWKDAVLDNAVSCIESTTQDVFDLCSGIAFRYSTTRKINGNSINGLIAMSTQITENNLFRNPILTASAKKLDEIKKIPPAQVDDLEEIVEDVLLDLYQYAHETGMEIKLPKKGLSKSNLDAMLKLRA